jgi:alcohol dehydrogenase
MPARRPRTTPPAAQEDICLRTNPRTASREQIIELYAAAQ